MNGTVPQVTANPFTTTRYGAGPFSSTNYYSLASPNSLQFGGDYSCTAVFVPASTASHLLMENWGASKGWLAWTVATNGYLRVYSNSTTLTTSDGVMSVSGPNVASWGRSGGSHYAKLNLDKTIIASAAITAANTLPTTIGYGPSTTVANPGTIYEIICSTAPFSESRAVLTHQQVLGARAGFSSVISYRNSEATYEGTSGAVWTVARYVPRITASGVVTEPTRTQYVLNSKTHPKAAEATATLPVGVYYARHAGSGTMTIEAGTATITGLSCASVAVGTPCTFEVTVTGTAVVTTSAGVTRAQIELGDSPTSWIDSAAAARTRAADETLLSLPSMPSSWCMGVTANRPGGASWGGTNLIWALGSARNSASLDMSSMLTVTDEANAAKTLATSGTPAAGAHRLNACFGGGASLAVDGTKASTADGAGSGAIALSPTRLFLGQYNDGHSTGSLWSGATISGLVLCSNSKCKAALPASSEATRRIVFIGDSITTGVLSSTPFPSIIAKSLGPTTAIWNLGVTGAKTDVMVGFWGTRGESVGADILVLNGGVNDISQGVSAATAWTSLKAIIDRAVSLGVTVVVGTVTPFKYDGGSWTAEYQTQLESLNTTIAGYCNGTTIRCVDMNAALRDPADDEQFLAAYTDDGLHPNDAGNVVAAALIVGALP